MNKEFKPQEQAADCVGRHGKKNQEDKGKHDIRISQEASAASRNAQKGISPLPRDIRP